MLILSRLIPVLLLATAFVMAPVRLVFIAGGMPMLELAAAWAKDGDESDDDGDDEDDGESDDDDSEDDGENGGDDEDDDETEDGDEDDDSGDEDDDESSDEESGSPVNSEQSETNSSWRPSGAIVRIEVSNSGIEIRYANGAREEIHNGRYRVRNEKGQRVVQRRATGPDVVRLRAISERVTIQSVSGQQRSGSAVESVSKRQNSLTVTYSNGWKETLRQNTYTLTDPYGRSVVMRPATAADVRRVNRIAKQNI